ncbi:hypothetical protein B0H13DRAFT_2068749, partial [Mycena leptocephala]
MCAQRDRCPALWNTTGIPPLKLCFRVNPCPLHRVESVPQTRYSLPRLINLIPNDEISGESSVSVCCCLLLIVSFGAELSSLHRSCWSLRYSALQSEFCGPLSSLRPSAWRVMSVRPARQAYWAQGWNTSGWANFARRPSSIAGAKLSRKSIQSS